MAIGIGDTAPDFTAESTEGTISLHEYLGGSWGEIFSHLRDFTPVSTTEVVAVAKLIPELVERDVKVLGLSVDTVDAHRRWIEELEATQGVTIDFPLLADERLEIAELYGMVHAHVSPSFTLRALYVIDPDKKVKLTLTYPASTGRNFDDLLRTIDSLQLAAEFIIGTPAGWQPGEDVIIRTSLSDADAEHHFPGGWRTLTPYLRLTPHPNT